MTTTWTDARIMNRLIELGGLRLAENLPESFQYLAVELNCGPQDWAAAEGATREQMERAEAALLEANPHLRPPALPPFGGNPDLVATKRLRPTGKERR